MNAKQFGALRSNIVKAIDALGETPVEEAFTQEELNEVLARVEDLKTALTARKA